MTNPATAISDSISNLITSTRVQRALSVIDQTLEEITRNQIEICSIPAPPFGERDRAEYFLRRFTELNLNSFIDMEGNAIGIRAGKDSSKAIVISAHLDTVFPAGTNFNVTVKEGRLFGPGVADDGCGLAGLLGILNAIDQSLIETDLSILFTGTVGEEGEGNLRGVRHLFTDGEWAKKIVSFISLDGPCVDRITNGALGSKRYRAIFRGQGGHSWGDFGRPNPVHAAARAINSLVSFIPPVSPRTTYNVGRIEGGSGVNVIPSEAIVDVDLRSESPEELTRLDDYFLRTVRDAVEAENRVSRSSTSTLSLNLKLIGDRPSGETPESASLVRSAISSSRYFSINPRLECSSTDSNIPISMGIAAITLGAGGRSANSHTLDEWYDPRGREVGLKRALLVLLAEAGVVNP
jgi:tripeptide aminopeptidase